MSAGGIVPLIGEDFETTLAAVSPDVLRTMIREFAQRLMDTEVESMCGAGYGEVNPRRANSRNGYRRREWSTRAGTIELAIPRLRFGSYYPQWLLEREPRAERVLASVVATSYLLGVSTQRVERLIESLGVTALSKAQLPSMVQELDEIVEGSRNRPLESLYTFVWVDALPQKIYEDDRMVNVHVLIAAGVNADGHREILGVDIASSEADVGWLTFLRGLTARGLTGVRLVVSNRHAGLRDALASTLPGVLAVLPDALRRPGDPADPG